jgi:hypothetical protein
MTNGKAICVLCGNGEHIEYPECCDFPPYCRIHCTDRMLHFKQHFRVE